MSQLTLSTGRTASTKTLITSAKEETKHSAMFTKWGLREARNMDLPTLREVFGEYAVWFYTNLRQHKITGVK